MRNDDRLPEVSDLLWSLSMLIDLCCTIQTMMCNPERSRSGPGKNYHVGMNEFESRTTRLKRTGTVAIVR